MKKVISLALEVKPGIILIKNRTAYKNEDDITSFLF